jgi:putative peptide zinc metalloprotease protein
MEGVGKVEAGERSLLWIWTHRFTDWLRLKSWGSGCREAPGPGAAIHRAAGTMSDTRPAVDQLVPRGGPAPAPARPCAHPPPCLPRRVWYVMEDRVAGKYHRFNSGLAPGHQPDGRPARHGRRLGRLTDLLADDTPAQEEVIRLLGQLHGADLVQCDVDAGRGRAVRARGKERRRKFMGRFMNPISLRFPLWDPDRTAGLDGCAGCARCRALGPAAVAGGGAAGAGAGAAVLADLTEELQREQLLAMDNLLIMALVFPLVKAGARARPRPGHAGMRGGEVHEMGVMLLVFFPMPYVEASSSSAFVKQDRP